MGLALHQNGNMLKIGKSGEQGRTSFALSGRIEEQHVPELLTLLAGEPEGSTIVFDLEEVRLVDRAVVRFLADCELRGIQLKNCPSYVREWMETGRL